MGIGGGRGQDKGCGGPPVDFSFFVIVIVCLLNIVSGIIIDTFAQLRDSRQAIEDDTRQKCFARGPGGGRPPQSSSPSTSPLSPSPPSPPPHHSPTPHPFHHHSSPPPPSSITNPTFVPPFAQLCCDGPP